MMPKPTQSGGVPIWVSGRCNGRVAQRLARFGRGWIPWGEDGADLVASIPRMRAAVDAAGGDAAALQVLGTLPLRRRPDRSLDLAASMDALPPLVDAGVTDFLAHLRLPEFVGRSARRLLGAGWRLQGGNHRLSSAPDGSDRPGRLLGRGRSDRHRDARVVRHAGDSIDVVLVGQPVDVGVLVAVRHGDGPAPHRRIGLRDPHDHPAAAGDGDRFTVDDAGGGRVVGVHDDLELLAQEVELGVQVAGLSTRDEHQRRRRRERGALLDEQRRRSSAHGLRALPRGTRRRASLPGTTR